MPPWPFHLVPSCLMHVQEALALEDEAGGDMGSDDLGSEDADDLDDYINSLKEESEGAE